jgi:hypothetical protein
MLTGSGVDLESSGGIVQSIHKTAAGRITHRFTWGPIEFDKFNQSRLNPAKQPEVDMIPRVIGNEPFPGEMRDRFIPRNGSPITLEMSMDSLSSLAVYRAWPRELRALVSAERLFDSLRTHIGLCHWRSIAVPEADWTEERRIRFNIEMSTFNRLKVHMRLTKLSNDHGFTIDTSLEVYRTLLMCGEFYGSTFSGRSHRSSFVMVRLWDQTGRKEMLKYGRVSFYFKHTFQGMPYYFAAIKYYTVR